ncbi:hypothetical protein ZWY2020_029496, partial [Hordeum vulgare]
MLRAAISSLGAHLHRQPSPATPPLRALSTGRGKRSSPTAPPPEPEDEGLMRGLFVLSRDPSHPPRLLVVQPRLRPGGLLDSKLSEALNLASSLEESRDGFEHAESAAKGGPPHLVVQNPASRGRNHAGNSLTSPCLLLTSTQVAEHTVFDGLGCGFIDSLIIRQGYKALLEVIIIFEEELHAVFVNTLLSGVQQRNLEVALGKPVLDRVGLIIEIFNAHAETKEAKLQSELAALMYMKTRLVRVRGPGGKLAFGASGEAEVVSARGRGFVDGDGAEHGSTTRPPWGHRVRNLRRSRALTRWALLGPAGSLSWPVATVEESLSPRRATASAGAGSMVASMVKARALTSRPSLRAADLNSLEGRLAIGPISDPEGSSTRHCGLPEVSTAQLDATGCTHDLEDGMATGWTL